MKDELPQDRWAPFHDEGPAPRMWRWVMYALCGWSLIAAGVLAFMNPEWLQWK